jgi:hypothetical protein
VSCNACVPFSLPTALRILLPDLSCSAPPARTSPATSSPPPSTLWCPIPDVAVACGRPACFRPPQAPPFEHARRCTTPLLHARPNPYCMPLSYCAQSSFPLNSTACVPAPCVYAVLYSGSSSRRLTGQPRLGRKTLRLHLGPLSEGASAGADAHATRSACHGATPSGPNGAFVSNAFVLERKGAFSTCLFFCWATRPRCSGASLALILHALSS